MSVVLFCIYRSLLAKVKVSSHILFPESLDLSQYGCQTNGEMFTFNLTGVIIHRGPTAYSGHYIAHILDNKVSHASLLSRRVILMCVLYRPASGTDLMMNMLAS